jgi:hypothetical protein
MSSLEEISIFTQSEDRPLKDVFRNILENFGEELDFDPKKLSTDELKEKFAVAVPDFNEEAVYPSDMKKVFVWYKLLIDKQLLDFSEDTSENNAEDVSEETTEVENN